MRELHQRAMCNPAQVYTRPADVVADGRLSDEQKTAILTRWELDARSLQVAEEENMTTEATGPSLLDEVLAALQEVGGSDNDRLSTPTKLG